MAETLTRPQAQERVRRMWEGGEGGWTKADLRRYLATHGVVVSKNTIARWVDPAYDEYRRTNSRESVRRAYRERNGITNPRVADEDGLRRRIAALGGAGVSKLDIGRVIALDHGVRLSDEAINRVLTTGAFPRANSRRKVAA